MYNTLKNKNFTKINLRVYLALKNNVKCLQIYTSYFKMCFTKDQRPAFMWKSLVNEQNM